MQTKQERNALSAFIDRLAAEAACASFDAHGRFVPAEMAWEFIASVYTDEERPEADLIPDYRPPEFGTSYERHCRNEREGYSDSIGSEL